MESVYKVLWTDHAISELKDTITYLETHWTNKELVNFSNKLDHTIELISKTPEIFPNALSKIEIRRAVVDKHNTLYYRKNNNSIEIISLFANKQDPTKKKI
ncbi:type II toxin-antitoxin system RelE/ParE family toxin [Algibacter pectinivorans]|uniref:Plasmid stabilization system protein ParE n=1 Tax=Algibacter pectinivorans TaxID=870482 RepID=A0A1I1P6Z6_9FLAO|nr:type II toxin-antitoxin system RelE/ParE family toxin [Algibacter pectinivorans]SFD05456.1 Plasmid stabilization system protein ParE [Algibacter pectinivorans]